MIITLTNGGDTVGKGYFYRNLLDISKKNNFRRISEEGEESPNFVENIVLFDV